MADIRNVLIKENGRVQDADCRKTLSKADGDKVRFFTLSGGPWTVVFPTGGDGGYNGTPFTADSFVVSVGTPATTSTPSEGVAGQTYKYQVKNSSGTIKDDPDILIEI